jgi:hypothetical protein
MTLARVSKCSSSIRSRILTCIPGVGGFTVSTKHRVRLTSVRRPIISQGLKDSLTAATVNANLGELRRSLIASVIWLLEAPCRP